MTIPHSILHLCPFICICKSFFIWIMKQASSWQYLLYCSCKLFYSCGPFITAIQWYDRTGVLKRSIDVLYRQFPKSDLTSYRLSLDYSTLNAFLKYQFTKEYFQSFTLNVWFYQSHQTIYSWVMVKWLKWTFLFNVLWGYSECWIHIREWHAYCAFENADLFELYKISCILENQLNGVSDFNI